MMDFPTAGAAEGTHEDTPKITDEKSLPYNIQELPKSSKR
jgi:hypothetical protein